MPKFRGGYNVWLEGKPSAALVSLPEPEALFLPLTSRRFTFTELSVADGDRVTRGQVLAVDAANYSVPLLAPRAGTVKLDREGHITLEELATSGSTEKPDGDARSVLLKLGAWQFFCDAATGDLPDPAVAPRAIIVSTLSLDPFVARGDVQLTGRVDAFARGLAKLHSLAESAPVALVVPALRTKLAAELRRTVSGLSWVTLLEVPLKYPAGSVKLAAEQLGLCDAADFVRPPAERGVVWGLQVEGVLAVERALVSSEPCVSRIVAIGGPGTTEALHVETCAGYPVAAIRERYTAEGPVRVIDGGALSGETVPEEQLGLDVECTGLTMIGENTGREVLAFTHIGFTKHAFMNAFASALLIHPFRERYTTAVRGEHRPCVSCGSCERACPARVMPFLISRYVAKDRLEDAQRVGMGLCVRCGLCSHVCLAKRETSQTIREGTEALREELQESGVLS